MNNTNMKNISLVSLDVKSLYTNIPVSNFIKYLENHFTKTNITFISYSDNQKLHMMH